MAQQSSSFSFLPLGAIIQEFRVGGLNIVQNFATPEQYKAHNKPFFGETIGRVCNRIQGAKLSGLNGGQEYPLIANNGANTLHGGPEGWGKREFLGPTPLSRRGRESVLFKYISADGEQGFPGTVEVRVYYTAGIDNEDGVEKTVLEVEYEVELVGEESAQETAVAVTNHGYFNLSGAATIEGTHVTLHTNQHLPVTDDAIPTGSIEPYPGITANESFTLGPEEPDVDHCFVKNLDPATVPLDTRAAPPTPNATFYHPDSKVHLEILSTEPAFQFYTGKFINVPEVDGIPARGKRAGFCIEPSRYVDAASRDEWKGMVILRRGQLWGAKNVYKAWRD